MDSVQGLRSRVGARLDSLTRQPSAPASTFWVGLSGGLDSSVLLDAVVHCGVVKREALAVIHVNHGLAEAADEWAEHCRGLAQGYGLAYRSTRLSLPGAGNVEANARAGRYQFFAETISPGDCVLTAHHADDQLETVLLKMLQGRAIKGMAASARVAGVPVLRPLLETSRDELLEYAHSLKLSWIEDPSNRDTDFDRNYLRQAIVPKLLDRWPQVRTRVADLANDQAALDATARWGMTRYQRDHPEGMAVDDLPEPADRARIWLRLYIEAQGHYEVTDAVIDEFLRQVFSGQKARVHWRSGVLELKAGLITVSALEK